MDFKENIVLPKGPVEGQRQFFSRTSVSVLGWAIYTFCPTSGDTTCMYVDFFSDIMNHDAVYVKDCINLLLPRLSQGHLSFWMDCGNHFRNYELLHFLLEVVAKERKQVIVNYFTEHHGKSPVDGHFSLLSRTLDQVSLSTHIDTIDVLISTLSLHFEKIKSAITLLTYTKRSTSQEIQVVDIKCGKTKVNITSNFFFAKVGQQLRCAQRFGEKSVLCTIKQRTKTNKRKETKKATELTMLRRKCVNIIGKTTLARLQKLSIKQK
jgi:hypothetical protein